jgi:hypothetical protein
MISTDFLNLAQRVLERAPIPQANILQRCLIVRRIGRFDCSFGGKFALRDLV